MTRIQPKPDVVSTSWAHWNIEVVKKAILQSSAIVTKCAKERVLVFYTLTLCCAIMQISVIYVRNFQIVIILLIFN